MPCAWQLMGEGYRILFGFSLHFVHPIRIPSPHWGGGYQFQWRLESHDSAWHVRSVEVAQKLDGKVILFATPGGRVW